MLVIDGKSKDSKFCPDILLFFREKMYGCFKKTSRHALVRIVILNTVLLPICTNIFEKLCLDSIYGFCRSELPVQQQPP